MIIDKIGIPAFHTGMNEVLISYHHTKRVELAELFPLLVKRRLFELTHDNRNYLVLHGNEFITFDERCKHGVETLCQRVFIALISPYDAKVGECVQWSRDMNEVDLGEMRFVEEAAALEPGDMVYYYRRVA